MKHNGDDPFQRPMRPDRVEMIRQVAEGVAQDSASDIEAGSFTEFTDSIAWNIFYALGSSWPDTMVAEIQAGLAEALPICRKEYERRHDSPEPETS